MKCFYHNDIDGKCAAAIVARATSNYCPENYIMYNYDGDFPTDIIKEGEKVYIVDLSFSKNTVDKLKEIAYEKKCELVWCDHHLSSMNIIAENPELAEIQGIREVGISGAALAWMYFSKKPYEEAPMFIKYVSDFDCWQMKYEESLYFKYAIESEEHGATDIIWNRLMRDSLSKEKPLLKSMVYDGKVISKYTEKEYERYKNSYSYESEIDGYKCLVVNRSCNSLIFGDSIKDYPIVAIWAFNGNNYKYSIYSDKEGIDCSKIAEKFGGGGHKGASGFVSDKMILKKLYK